MSKSTLLVSDITCGGCANSIKLALTKLPGVGSVEVDVASKTVEVEYSELTTISLIEAKLDDIGFPVSK